LYHEEGLLRVSDSQSSHRVSCSHSLYDSGLRIVLRLSPVGFYVPFHDFASATVADLREVRRRRAQATHVTDLQAG